MTAQTKLTETQIVILKAATGRPDGNIEPLPTNLRGGARPKVIEGLLAKGLVTDADGCHLLTDAGYAAVGKRRPGHKGVQKADALNAVRRNEHFQDAFVLGTRPLGGEAQVNGFPGHDSGVDDRRGVVFGVCAFKERFRHA